MTNLGKIAYHKVKDLSRDFALNSGFNHYFERLNLNNENSFEINIKTKNEKIFFKLNLPENNNLKVYVNSNLEFAKKNFTAVGFYLYVEGNSTIKFEFDSSITMAEISAIGKCEVVKTNNLKVFSGSNYLVAANQLVNNFNLVVGEGVNELVDNFNNGNFQNFNGNLLDCYKSNNETILFINKNNATYVNNLNVETEFSVVISENGCIEKRLAYNQYEYVCADVVGGQLVFYFVDNNNNVETKTFNIKINDILKSVKRVFNYFNDELYLLLTDNSNNNFIVKCKFNSSVNSFGLSYVYNLGKNENMQVAKVQSNLFLLTAQTENGAKISQFELDIDKLKFNLLSNKNYNNATSLIVNNFNINLLNFNNTLICDSGE